MLMTAHLVELQHVQQVKELAVLLAVLQLAVVLLQAVEGQLRLVVHKHLHGLETGGMSQESGAPHRLWCRTEPILGLSLFIRSSNIRSKVG